MQQHLTDYVRFEVLTAVRMAMVFWVVTPCRQVGRYKRFGKHTASIFRVEVAMLGSGDIYTGSEEAQAGGGGIRNVSPKLWNLICESTRLHKPQNRHFIGYIEI
jgi:hypothetical protein